MKSRQLRTLQAGRGLAAISVILQHVHYTMLAPNYFNVNFAHFLEAAKSGVQFFFVLSGFVIYLAHRKDIGNPVSLAAFLWKRFRRIYPLLWLVLSLVLATFFLVPSFGAQVDKSLGTVLSAFLIIPSPNEHLLFVEWTLRHEVLFYAVFSLLLLNRRLGWPVLFAWIALSAVIPWCHPSQVLDFVFNANHVLFAMGILICILSKRYPNPGLMAHWTLLIGGTLFATAWWWQCHLPDPYENPPANILFFGLGAAVFILGLVWLEGEGKVRVASILVFLGEASYAIYLVHQPTTIVAAKLLLRTPLRGQPVVVFFVLTLAGILSGIVVHLGFERPVTRLLSQKRALPVTASV